MKDKAHEYLVNWSMDYLKNKDLFLKKIESIKKANKGFDIYVKFKDSLKSEISNLSETQSVSEHAQKSPISDTYKSLIRKKEQFFIIKPIIEDIDEILSRLDNENWYGLVVFNTPGNFDILINNWDKFVKFKHLCMYFVNPFSQLDKKWIIYPHTHNNICEKDALEKGLRAMCDVVEPLTEGKIKDTFK